MTLDIFIIQIKYDKLVMHHFVVYWQAQSWLQNIKKNENIPKLLNLILKVKLDYYT